ncbi:MAG: gliding motility-associated C-terminal domain-containing protein [Bacteroidales bacterium]|jgi:gliding motility-associated-like protein
MIINYKKSVLTIALMLVVSLCFSQSDTVFWFVAPDIVQKQNNDVFEVPIIFNIASFCNQQVNVKISQPASPSFPVIYKTIAANSSIEIDVSAYINEIENKPANSILNKGILIETSDFVSIYYSINLGNNNPESFSLKGQNALGTEFFIPGQNQIKNREKYNHEIPPYNKFDIVATMDSTSITIIPKNDIIGHKAQIPFTIMLNKGQSYSAVATSQLGLYHLAGSQVTADKPIAITVTDDLLEIDPCADLIGDQIVPIDKIGVEYIVIKGQLSDNNDQVYITATENNTLVTLYGSTSNSFNLSKGETKGFYYQSTSNTMYITADKPIYCFQLTGMGCELGGAIVPPIVCTGSNKVAYRRGIAAKTNQLILNVFTTTSNISLFKINGNASLLTSDNFYNVEGTNGKWKYATKDFSSIIAQDALLTVTNDGLFHMATFDGYVIHGCSYNYFSDFKKSSELIISPMKNTYCIGKNFQISFTYKNLENIECICPNGKILKTPPFLISSATINDSGKYIIKGENIFGCDTMVSDSVFIHIVPGITTTYYDTICQGEHYTNNGFDTIFMIPGNYIFDSIINDCDTLRLEIFVAPSHYLFTYYDSICEGERYVGHGIDTVFNEKGTYCKYYSYKCDSLIKIQITIKEVTRVFLGKDIILCSELDFPVKIDAGTEFMTYQWNTSENTSFIYAPKVGTYYVTVTNYEGCKHSDTISVFLEKIPIKIENLTLDYCENFSSTFKVTTQSDSVLWSTGQTSHQIEITKPGTYTVTVFKSKCINTDSITIDTCDFNLFLPNTITPFDNNNLNDYFSLILPKKHQIKSIHIDIFDRWGNRVFSSKDINFKWRGEINGKNAHNNIFSYVLKVSLDDNRHYIYKGFILVM